MRSLDSLWRYAHAGHPVSPRDYRGLTASAFSLPWRSAKELEEKRDKIKRQITHHLQEHKRTDKSEARDEEKRKRSEQAIETLNKAFNKIDNFLKSASPRMGQGKRPKE
ncbi:MAG: hypothetical protein RNU03_12250 [Candidatus Sedimenticola sp. (ex Thyasira tokunagai)]